MKINIVSHIGAGGNTGKKTLKSLLEYCDKKSISYAVNISEYKGHTIELVKKLSTEDEKLVLIGGDGTLHEAVNALKIIGSKKPIAYLPSGTGNDFARELKITSNPERFIDSLLELESPEELEIIKFTNLNSGNVGYSINSIGFGIDAMIIYLSSINTGKSILKKIGLGKLSYLHYIVSAVKKHKNFDVVLEINNEEYRFGNCLLALVTNHPYFGGGVKIDPYSTSNNNELGFVVANEIKFIDLVMILYRILKFGDHFEKYEKIKRIGSTSMIVRTRVPQYIQADGESQSPEVISMKFELEKYPFWICR